MLRAFDTLSAAAALVRRLAGRGRPAAVGRRGRRSGGRAVPGDPERRRRARRGAAPRAGPGAAGVRLRLGRRRRLWRARGSSVARKGWARFVAAYRRPDGLFINRVAADGAPLDTEADIYEQAFALLAMAALTALDPAAGGLEPRGRAGAGRPAAPAGGGRRLPRERRRTPTRPTATCTSSRARWPGSRSAGARLGARCPTRCRPWP